MVSTDHVSKSTLRPFRRLLSLSRCTQWTGTASQSRQSSPDQARHPTAQDGQDKSLLPTALANTRRSAFNSPTSLTVTPSQTVQASDIPSANTVERRAAWKESASLPASPAGNLAVDNGNAAFPSLLTLSPGQSTAARAQLVAARAVSGNGTLAMTGNFNASWRSVYRRNATTELEIFLSNQHHSTAKGCHVVPSITACRRPSDYNAGQFTL